MKKNSFIVNNFLEDGFNLKSHLIEFLPIEPQHLNRLLDSAKNELANLHPGDNSLNCEDFYKEIVGDKHLAELAAWHISSKEYIAETLRLQEIFANNIVLDFGGGIGTHALANAMADNVDHVFFVDINETNRKFVEFRAKKLGLEKKLSFHQSIQETGISKFDTIICLDVLEHLSEPSIQLNIFYEIMKVNSVALFNWYFYKGDNNEYPFHIDDEKIINLFFTTLQSKFLEIFHPIIVTTRAYKKVEVI